MIDETNANFEKVYEQSKTNGTTGSVPTTVHNVSLLGTTGSTTESIIFVKKWLAALREANVDLSQYNLIMDKIDWSDTTVGS
jgi:hypothetical protein